MRVAGRCPTPRARDTRLKYSEPEFLLPANVPVNSCTAPTRHGRITHHLEDVPYEGFGPDQPCCPPLSHGSSRFEVDDRPLICFSSLSPWSVDTHHNKCSTGNSLQCSQTSVNVMAPRPSVSPTMCLRKSVLFHVMFLVQNCIASTSSSRCQRRWVGLPAHSAVATDPGPRNRDPPTGR